MGAVAQHRAPATRARVSAARAVGPDLHDPTGRLVHHATKPTEATCTDRRPATR
uniref:Uncharacterized protein n=1 Tax=Verrucosispora sp. MS100047 TaxID=1410949 RepID=A0A097CRN9_9ACTN|nr:hypothetical protein VASRM7_62 [Verrucosispora sp. MS100047]